VRSLTEDASRVTGKGARKGKNNLKENYPILTKKEGGKRNNLKITKNVIAKGGRGKKNQGVAASFISNF